MRLSRKDAAALLGKTQSKYRNRKTTVDGIVFHSAKEAKRYGELKLLEKAGKIWGLELQPRYAITVHRVKVCSYAADFRYCDSERGWIVEDVKGFRTQAYRLKKRLMKACYGIEVVEV